jgi:hypothetical protein
MVVDTGADHTCFPAAYARFLGHDNGNGNVKKSRNFGIGGACISYKHTLSIALLNPYEYFIPGKSPSIIWESPLTEYSFLEGFNDSYGLLGRDLIRLWDKISFSPRGKGWTIEIEIPDSQLINKSDIA